MSAKKNPPENSITVIRELASKGAAQRSISRALNVSYDTWLRWKDEEPGIKDALADGRSIEHDILVGCLLDSAITQKNVTAAIFLLKTRHGYRENKPINDNRPQITINFELPGAVSADVYEAEILKKSIPAKDLKKIGK